MLTEKKKKLADAWLKLDNLAEAYYASGYSTNVSRASARSMAHRLINKDQDVKDYIKQRLAELEDERIAEVSEVLKYLTSVMRGQSQAEVVVVEGEGDGVSSARRIQKAPDERERLKAAELLGRKYGMFTDKQEIDLNAMVTFVDDVPLTDD